VQPRASWELDQESLDRLLTALGGDRAAAATQYERLRLRLIRFFEWEKSPLPDQDADETLNRVARRLSEGAEIKSIVAFALGVARFVLRERQAQTQRLERALEEMAATAGSTSAAPSETDSRLLACFRSCFARLPEESRALLRRYYGGADSERIRNRAALARESGVEPNALRNRVFRIREKLMTCIRHCVRQPSRDFSRYKSADSFTSITEDS
jgi:DNA-directed RNA polymerase specialized sigma24 family protein